MLFEMNIVKFVALAAVLSSPISAGTIEAPTNRLIIIRGDTVAVHFEVEIADSHAERSRGLMGRGKLDSRTGMWFDFKDSGLISVLLQLTLLW